MLCMDQKKIFLNDHDQGNLSVISEVTNLGSYSSSHQGMCLAAPWEAVFYKQTDRDLCRKCWSKTAGLYACAGQERGEKDNYAWEEAGPSSLLAHGQTRHSLIS